MSETEKIALQMTLNDDNNASNGTKMSDTKINNNSPIHCRVTHTISAADKRRRSSSRTIKMLIITIFLLTTIIGTIIACIISQKVAPFFPVPPTDPVNGQWCPWSSWSRCSITCSNDIAKYGLMTRLRYCNSPPVQLGGKNCSGNSNETETCFEKPCPVPIDGNWGDWNEWSNCDKNCQDPNRVPLQWRNRSCDNPVPKDGGANCIGESHHQKFCDWLPQCPRDGQWGGWHVSGPCESRDKKSCAMGSQRYSRQCNSPSPTGTGKPCEGIREKIVDCWFFIGCPVDLQPPLDLNVIGNGTGLFNVSWYSVPYGKAAVKYRIYKTLEDEKQKDIDTFYEEHNVTPSKKINIHPYWKIIDLRKYMTITSFKTLAIRMTSIDYWNEESTFTTPVRSLVKAVDGKWSEWTHWSDCSVTCRNQKGDRTRTRECNNPPPSDGGKPCQGKLEDKITCIGMEDNCF